MTNKKQAKKAAPKVCAKTPEKKTVKAIKPEQKKVVTASKKNVTTVTDEAFNKLRAKHPKLARVSVVELYAFYKEVLAAAKKAK